MTVQIKPAPIRHAVTVKASQERAFRIFTSDIGRWWPSTHHIGAAPYKANVLEPRQGGRWYEIGEDGSEADWGHVLAWEPPSRLLLAWQLDAQHRFDPALVTEVEVLFTPQDDGRTRVELEHRLLERYGEDAQKVADSVGSPNGWGRVLELFADAANA
ncbi:MAG: SRPBCC family protein [Pseudomonadota bacterium]|uniref:SRPBCC family protein n=1 Tax=Phenylobacterium sp. TaxID=1871053 RepID=UPI0025DE9267|nr:SRPBCC family protein [Phenylobacterium sp.]MBT9471854.1 SRPBCC family protein [Phenylobacterium sp.]